MSLLTIVQNVSRRLGLDIPPAVVGTTDPAVYQLQGLLEEVGNTLVLDYNWQALRKSTNWTSVAGANQGTLASRTGSGYKAVVRGTFWNFTLRRPVFGPISDQDWQMLQAFQPGGPLYQYRIAGNEVLVNPAMPAGQSLGWIWESDWWVANAGGTSIGQTFTSDSDISLLPEDMMEVGLQARWNEEKGLPYAELARRFQTMVDSYKAKDGTKQMLSMDRPSQRLVPGIFVPAGNWPV